MPWEKNFDIGVPEKIVVDYKVLQFQIR